MTITIGIKTRYIIRLEKSIRKYWIIRKHTPIPPMIIQRKFGALRVLMSVYEAKDRIRTPTRNLNTFNNVRYSFI